MAASVSGVPCFILEGKYALPGTHGPEAFQPLLNLALQEAAPLARPAALQGARFCPPPPLGGVIMHGVPRYAFDLRQGG
jgi:hypothetical protein